MSHKTSSGLQQQTQSICHNTDILPDFLTDIWDAGTPTAQDSSPAIQPTNFIHHPPVARGNKSHRYMTRQTQPPPEQRSLNNGSPIVFRQLPFYDKSCFLIVPTGMKSRGMIGKPNEAEISFRLTVDQADFVAMDGDRVNIILRFCHLEQSPEQDDNFPPDISITVNGAQVMLAPAISNPNRPNVPAKRPGQHVDITRLCKLCPFVNNHIRVTWFIDPTEPNRQYATTIIIGEKVSPDELLMRIKDRGLSNPDNTKKLISDSDSEVATTNLQCSLMCPLGKMKMMTPCKSTKCNHIPCFDASIYLQMNEKKATWICPVCSQPAYYPDLMIDGYFMDILQKTGPNVTDVTLHVDGSWKSVLKMEQQSTAKCLQPEIITISSDEDE